MYHRMFIFTDKVKWYITSKNSITKCVCVLHICTQCIYNDDIYYYSWLMCIMMACKQVPIKKVNRYVFL